jgi:threonine dehydrogenase-like Zn-dependent dehydrogenase
MNAADHSPPLLMHLGILGAGPIGLEMAASAVRAGHRVTVFERGAEIAANMRSWGHVRLFSSNALNLSADGSALLQEAGVALPETEAFPTGAEYVAQYLEPLAAALLKSGKADIRCDCEVLSVGRGSLTKGQAIGANPKRSAAPFELLVLQQGGEEQLVGGLDGLVDASGTYGNPNFLGKGGRPALGERALRADGTIKYVLPNDGPDADALLAAGR